MTYEDFVKNNGNDHATGAVHNIVKQLTRNWVSGHSIISMAQGIRLSKFVKVLLLISDARAAPFPAPSR